MSNWKPGKGFMAMVEQTKRSDLARKLKRNVVVAQKPARPGGGESPKEAKSHVFRNIMPCCMEENDCDSCDYRGPEHGGPHCHTLS